MTNSFKKYIALISFLASLPFDLYAEGEKSINAGIVLFVWGIILVINLIPIGMYLSTRHNSRSSIALPVFSILVVLLNLYGMYTTPASNILIGVLIALIGLNIYFLVFFAKRYE